MSRRSPKCATCSRAATPAAARRKMPRRPMRRSPNSPNRCARAARNSGLALEGSEMGNLGRRTVLAGSAALVATSGTVFAQTAAPRQKGPLVWLELDQQELDDAYDQSKYAANLQQIVKRYGTNSEAVRKRLGNPVRLAYGPTPVEGLDLYPARGQNAPIHVFIHGGAWRGGSAKDSAYQAETFVRAGAHYIALDFNNVVKTKGDLMPMADQVRRALAWVYKNAASFGGDPNRIFL